MAMTIVEASPGITGGIDTHSDTHVAAALDPQGWTFQEGRHHSHSEALRRPRGLSLPASRLNPRAEGLTHP